MKDQQQHEVEPWPRSVRYALLAVFVAFVGTGLVVGLYDRGVLPLAGPFVAMLLVPLVLVLRSLRLRRRRDRLVVALVEDLRALSAALSAERATGAQARPSAASDSALRQAATTVDAALDDLASGRQVAGAAGVEELTRLSAPWGPEAPVTALTRRTVGTAARLSAVLRSAEKVLARGDRR